MLTALCDGCITRFNADELSPVSEDMKVCPCCALLMLLYHKRGVSKKFERGILIPERLPKPYRKIVAEFRKDPMATVRKYAPEELLDSDIMAGKFTLDQDDFDRIEKGWDFLLLDDKQAELFKPEAGKEVQISTEKKKINRQIYSVRRFSENEGQQYRKGAFTACFIPEEMAV